ncbi:hypothetical protein AB5N19_13333 [Seiridium cardinale]
MSQQLFFNATSDKEVLDQGITQYLCAHFTSKGDGQYVNIGEGVVDEAQRAQLISNADFLERRCDMCMMEAHCTAYENIVFAVLKNLETMKHGSLVVIDNQFNTANRTHHEYHDWLEDRATNPPAFVQELQACGSSKAIESLAETVSQEVSLIKVDLVSLQHQFNELKDFTEELRQQAAYLNKILSNPWPLIDMAGEPEHIPECAGRAVIHLRSQLGPHLVAIARAIDEREPYLKKWDTILTLSRPFHDKWDAILTASRSLRHHDN